MFKISPFTASDLAASEALLDRAFGPGRLSKTSYAFRDGVDPVAPLRFVARDENGVLVGSIACWPILIGDGDRPALLLGPVGIEPALQGRGIGAALIGETLTRAATLGFRLVLLVGDPAYYVRFGFLPVPADTVIMPGERTERLQYYELVPGALAEVNGPIRRWQPGPSPCPATGSPTSGRLSSAAGGYTP